MIQKMILEGKVLLDNSVPAKPHYRVKSGENLTVIVEEKEAGGISSEAIPLDVVYEDLDLAVINKQPGLVVHPAPGNTEHTLVNALLHRFGELSSVNSERPGIVHRLDKETSGILVIAKNNFTHLNLAEQFAQHTIKRKYIAVVKGEMVFDEDVIELPIGRHPRRRENMSVEFTTDSKYAKTRYRTLKRSKAASLVELELFTGRTHQIRVHLSFLGHPVLGDAKYGKNNLFPRMALHAQYLGFIHPRTNKFMEFSSPVPPEFLAAFSKS